MDTISIDDFKKVDIRIGEILSAQKVEDADKLLRLMVRFGIQPAVGTEATSEITPETGEPHYEDRQIISGIAEYFPDPQALVGIKCAFAYNLQSRTIRGLTSYGMILASTGDNGVFSLLKADADLPSGSTVR
jgi:methionyl-tRNA synthetase